MATSSSEVKGFASEAPAQILLVSARAAHSAKSVRMSGTLQASNFKHGNFTFALVFPSRGSFTIVRGESRLQAIFSPSVLDLRANLAYWDAKAPRAIARRYANRWLTLTGSAGAKFVNEFQALAKAYALRSVACTLAEYPHPTLVGTPTVAGEPSVELHSTGPSGNDSLDVYIATAAPHLTLRVDVTRHAAEPPLRSCAGIHGTKPGSGHVSYYDWNTATIPAPTHVTAVP
jgi:hypothetical protein